MAAKPGPTNRKSKFRGATDNYSTPREASDPFLDAYQLMNRCVWEPAVGAGALAAALTAHGYNVAETGLPEQDFFRFKKALAPTIITNPPYNVVDKWLSHCLWLEPDEIVLLLKLKFLEGAKRYETLHRKHPPHLIYQFVERIVFYADDVPRSVQPGWNTEAFAWFVWHRGFRGDPSIRWLHRGNNGVLL